MDVRAGIIAHPAGLKVKSQSGSECPTASLEIRLVVGSHIAKSDIEITVNQEILFLNIQFSQFLRDSGIGVVQNQRLYAVFQKTHRSGHPVQLHHREQSGLAVPPNRMRLWYEYKLLSQSTLFLILIQGEH